MDDPSKTLPDLVRFGLESQEDNPIHLDDELLDIFRYLRSPEAIPFFIEYIRRDPVTLPDSLVEALYPIRTASARATDRAVSHARRGQSAKSHSCWRRFGSMIRGSSKSCSTGWSMTRAMARFAWDCTGIPRQSPPSKSCLRR